MEVWFEKYKGMIKKVGIPSKEQAAIIDEAGTFIGYGKLEGCGHKGEEGGAGGGGGRAGVDLRACCWCSRWGPAATMLPAPGVKRVGHPGDHGYAIHMPGTFKTPPPPGMTAAGTQVFPGLKVRHQLEEETRHTGKQKPLPPGHCAGARWRADR